MSTKATSHQSTSNRQPRRTYAEVLRSSQHSRAATSASTRTSEKKTPSSHAMITGLPAEFSRVLTFIGQRSSEALSAAYNYATGTGPRDPDAVQGQIDCPSSSRLGNPIELATLNHQPSGSARLPAVAEEPTPPPSRSQTHGPDPTTVLGASSASVDQLANIHTPPDSAPRSRDESAIASPTAEEDLPDDFTPLRRYTTYRAGQHVSTGASPWQSIHQPNENAATNQARTRSSSSSSSSSFYISYSELLELNRSWSVTEARLDPVAYHNRIVRRIEAIFHYQELHTRAERRAFLHDEDNPWVKWWTGMRWMHDYPSDMWDSDEEEAQGWSIMYADEYAERSKQKYERFGYYRQFVDDQTGPREKWTGKRIEIRVAHKKLFGKEWGLGKGKWEDECKNPVPESLGPRDERVEDL